MVEFCLAIPLLAAVIVVTWFFGWAMKNQQKVRTAARHAAWSHQPVDGSISTYYNDRFFNNSAVGIGIHGGGGPDDVHDAFTDEVGAYTGPGYDLMAELNARYTPRGWRRFVSATFPTDVGYWQRFQGAIHANHARDGRSWTRGQLGYSRLLREHYLDELEESMISVPAEGTGLADMIRRLYHGGW
ncbi:MAG: TadE/TadG family type IV pilus assembly protein [Planctomycetota bacterium]